MAGRHCQEDEREGDRNHGMAVLQVSLEKLLNVQFATKILFQMGHLCGQASPHSHSPVHVNHGSLRGRIKIEV